MSSAKCCPFRLGLNVLSTNSCTLNVHVPINTLRPTQDGRHFADVVFKFIFLNENVWFLLMISLKCVPKDRINNIPALVQIKAWRRTGDKPPLNQWCLDYRRIYASLGLNDLNCNPFWKKAVEKRISSEWVYITWVLFIYGLSGFPAPMEFYFQLYIHNEFFNILVLHTMIIHICNSKHHNQTSYKITCKCFWSLASGIKGELIMNFCRHLPLPVIDEGISLVISALAVNCWQ